MISIVALSVSMASAQSVSESYVIGVRPKTYLNIGGTSGVSIVDTTGLYAGGVLGFSRVKGNHTLGVSTEWFYDSNLTGLTGTLGPKVGLLMGELDGGAVMNTGSDSTTWGGYARLGLNFGLASSYYRVLVLSERTTTHHIGVTLKFPQQLGYQPRLEY